MDHQIPDIIGSLLSSEENAAPLYTLKCVERERTSHEIASEPTGPSR